MTEQTQLVEMINGQVTTTSREVAGVKIRRDLRDKDFDTVTQLISIWTPAAATIYQLKQMELEV